MSILKRRNSGFLASIIFVGGLAIGTWCIYARSPWANVRRLAIAKVSPLRVNLGNIKVEGDSEVVITKITIKNVGNDVLKILSTSSSCGCTMPHLPQLSLLPESLLVVPISVKVSPKRGAGSSNVTFVMNDKSNPVTTVTITWNIITTLAIDPEEIDFGILHSNVTKEAVLRVTDDDELREVCPTLHSLSESLTVSPIRTYAQGQITQNQASFAVKLSPGYKFGKHRDFLKMTNPDRVIPVHWELAASVIITPAALVSIDKLPGQELDEVVVIESNSGRGLPNIMVRTDDPHMEWIHVENEGTKLIRCRIKGKAPMKIGLHKVKLLVIDNINKNAIGEKEKLIGRSSCEVKRMMRLNAK